MTTVSTDPILTELLASTAIESTVSNNQNYESQITHTLPRVSVENGELDSLLRMLIAARAARGKRKVLRVPNVRKSNTDSGVFDRVRLHLRRLARRTLNDLAKADMRIPDEAALTAALAAYVRDQCSGVVRMREPGMPSLSSRERRLYLDGADAVDRVALSAARYAIEGWTPDYILERQRRGAKGGKVSKRPTARLALLDSLEGMADLTPQKQAAELGVSRATLFRMKADLREREQATTDREYVDLLDIELDLSWPALAPNFDPTANSS